MNHEIAVLIRSSNQLKTELPENRVEIYDDDDQLFKIQELLK